MTDSTLASLGWTPDFARQALPGDTPARIAEVRRDHLVALAAAGPLRLAAPEGAGAYAVGDWVLTDGASALRRLDRRTEIARRGAGEGDGAGARRQLIAANVDALGIVTSCNADFNPARLERYLAVALTAGCLPLVILTKADQADRADPGPFLDAARRLSPLLTALALDARDAAEARRLDPWCGPGLTLALVGSSGVGKTTLQNALTGVAAATRDIREDDARGRHTTTARALRPALAGGCLIDTPGMRELGLADAAQGVAEVFADIAELAQGCRFRDCAHEAEPGCAVRAAVEAGALDAARVRRSRKLDREDRLGTQALHERRAQGRAFGRLTRAGKARGDWKRGDGR